MSRDKHWIDLKSAAELTARWRKHNANAPKAMGFERAALDRILKQDGCVAVRCYYAQKADESWTLVLVGVDAEGKDLTAGEIAEEAQPCPPWCDDRSPLWGAR